MNTPDPDSTLLPSIRMLRDFIGQETLKVRLQQQIDHSKVKGYSLDHFLFIGPDDIGKRTLACLLANEMGVNIKITDAHGVPKVGDLATLLTNLRAGDILLIENVDQLKPVIIKTLIPAIGYFDLNIVIGKGPAARPIRLKLPRFSFIGTTSKPSQVGKRLLRWVIPFDFVSYSLSEIEEFVILIGEQLNLFVSQDAARILAPYYDGNPGHVKALITRIRSYYNVESGGLSPETAQEVLIHFGYNPQAENSFDWIKILQNMSGIEFENFIAEIFQRKGYSVEFTSISGDHGIDLILKRNTEIIAVQCKKWSSPVGEAVIRDFLGSMHHAGIKIGVVIATTTFSSQAEAFVKSKPIKLINLDNLIQLIR